MAGIELAWKIVILQIESLFLNIIDANTTRHQRMLMVICKYKPQARYNQQLLAHFCNHDNGNTHNGNLE